MKKYAKKKMDIMNKYLYLKATLKILVATDKDLD